jgi:N-acetylneuraminic acid mutarotase
LTPLDGNAGFCRFLHVYDLKSGKWKQLADSHVTHPNSAAGVIGRKFYVAGGGGESPHNTLEVYDPAAAKWLVKAPMPTARVGCVGAVLNDRLYVIGGSIGTNFLATVESYDPVTDQWRIEPPLLSARTGAGAGVIQGELYVVGGCSLPGRFSETVEKWRPGSQWEIVTKTSLTNAMEIPFPVAKAFVTVINDALFVAGGVGSGGPVSRCQFYLPGRNYWDFRSNLPEIRYEGSGGVVIGGEVWVFGGWTTSLENKEALPHPEVFVFNTRENSWRPSSPR